MSWFGKLFGSRRSDDVDAYDEIEETEEAIVSAPVVKRRGIQLPRFQGNASDKVRPGFDSKLEQIRMRLRGAFTPSRPVLDAGMFAGRRALLTHVIRSIEDQQLHVVLYGPRGIGKTSTLHILCQIAKDARYTVRYTSCGEQVQFDDMFRAILDDIPLLYHADYDPTSDEIEEGMTFGSLVGSAPLTVSHVSEILSRISGTRLLLVFDEFDRILSPEFRRSIAELIKNLSDRASRVQLVIAGVASNLNEIIEMIPSIRRNILGIPVPAMDSEELIEMIRIGERESGLHCSPEAATLISELAHGLPYLAGLIGLHAGLSALDRRRSIISELDVWTGVQHAFEEINLRLSPATRHQLDVATKAGHSEPLRLLSRTALHSGGLVVPEQIDPGTGEKNPSIAQMTKLADEFQLLTPVPQNPHNAFIFVDEGAPLYVWMRGADARAALAVAGNEKVTAA